MTVFIILMSFECKLEEIIRLFKEPRQRRKSDEAERPEIIGELEVKPAKKRVNSRDIALKKFIFGS